MSSLVKRIIAIVVAAAVIGGIVFYKINDSRIYYNDTAVNGNTVSNLNENGLFCEMNGVVYFANPSDDNALYQMSPDETLVTKICDDRVYYINADSHYIYYSRDNNNDESQMSFLNVNTNSLCRVNTDGKKITILDDAVCSALSLSGNKLYYHHYDTDDATTLYSIDIDGKNKEQVFDDSTDPRCMIGDTLYYSGVVSDHNLHKLNTSNNSSSVVSSEWIWMPVVVGSTCYCMDLNENNRICAINLSDGTKQMISTYGTSDFNVYGNYIFYQTIKGDTDGLYRIDLSTMEETLIAAGQFNSINTTSKYVYYVDYFTGVTYHCLLTGNNPSVFTPPVEIESN